MLSLKNYILKNFGVDESLFQAALTLNPGSKGYILGAISELLLRDYLEKNDFEVVRIKEKPKGGNNAKSSKARGDFYIKPKGSKDDNWLVLESKGLKSNSEFRGNKLDNRTKVYRFLKSLAFIDKKHKENVYKSGYQMYLRNKISWKKVNHGKTFPPFNWSKNHPGPMNADLTNLWTNTEELEMWLEKQPLEKFTEEAYRNANGVVSILETHLPDTRVSPITGIKLATPLIYDFNILTIDLFLRTGKHEFVFATSNDLSHSPSSPEHLYQNYTIDILVKGKKEDVVIKPPWYKDIKECISRTNPTPRSMDLSQIDNR